MLLIGLLGISGVGALLAIRIYPQKDGLTTVGLSYPIGAGLVTLCMFFVNILGGTWNEMYIQILSITCFGITVMYGVLHLVKGCSNESLREITKSTVVLRNPLMLWVLVLLSVVLVGTLVAGLYWPVSDWDDVPLYDFRGVLWAQGGTVRVPIVEQSDYLKSFPPMISLLHSWFYLLGGTNAHLLHFLFLGSLCFLCFSIFKKDRSLLFALFGTCILVLMPEISRHGMIAYTNLASILYLIAGIYPLTQGKVPAGQAIFLGFLLGLGGWTRYITEPMVLASLLAISILELIIHREWRRDVIMAGLTYLVIDFLWIGYQTIALQGLSARYQTEMVSLSALWDGRLFQLTWMWLELASAPALFGAVLPLFLTVLILDRAKSEPLLLGVLVAIWLGWMTTFLIVDQGNIADFVYATGFRVWMPGAVLMFIWVMRSSIARTADEILSKMTASKSSISMD